MATYKETLLYKIRTDPRYSPQNSAKWFQSKIRELAGTPRISSMQMLANSQINQVTRIEPGRMYMFVYSPKHAKTLPFYDTFPIILPVEMYHNGFLGLNLHYLDYQTRMVLLYKLMQIAGVRRGAKGKGAIDYMRLSYQMLKSAINIPEIQPCIKRYLSGYVRSRFIHVLSDDWHSAIMLPSEQFKKASPEDVWKDSREKIKKQKMKIGK